MVADSSLNYYSEKTTSNLLSSSTNRLGSSKKQASSWFVVGACCLAERGRNWFDAQDHTKTSCFSRLGARTPKMGLSSVENGTLFSRIQMVVGMATMDECLSDLTRPQQPSMISCRSK